ncbi:carboxypeptidase-like regulatory domain-containing protein [Haloarcula sp. S1AR25-5A]|uniref:Carboxypeptidase-like regulatory domain-containing protein n=2 Tax=Haloarcula terrestris TaxID=2950533 RepID=A0AAE4EXB7_9EURY|nr:carboxypeptidase-like regulatory domain-containing protein [Haloarcula terrestris]
MNRQVETPTPDNETQQQNPDSVSDGEYSDETAAWLARTMGAQLENSSIALSNEQYDRARSVLGDDYNERLEQYVEVAGDTSSEADDAAAREFEAARGNQQNFTNEVQRYRQQYAAYQAARETGNEREARITARQMERTAANISDTRQRLNRNFEQIENTTTVDLSEGQGEINETTANITATQSEVREETLVGTTLTVQARDSTASFSEPGTITGQLQAENGSVIADAQVELRVENRTRTVQTDSNGAFETRYRPRSARLGSQSVEVEYIPSADSVYLTDNATFTITVQQVTPDVTSDISPETVGYGDRLDASASVTADSTVVTDIPVEFVMGDTAVARTTTGPNGSVTAAVRVPASVDDGDRQVVARIPYQDRAIAGSQSEHPVVVVETQTDLSVSASRTDDGILARGRLQTVDGAPVANLPVRLQVGAGETQVVETTRNGSFRAVIADPQSGESVTVTATYDEPRSNLGNATATATVGAGAGGGNPPVGSGSDRDILIDTLLGILFGSDENPGISFGNGVIGYSWLPVLGGGMALIVVGASWFVVSRFNQSEDAETTAPAGTVDSSTIEPDQLTTSSDDTGPTFEDRVDTYLDSGNYDAATMLAYTVVHDELVSENGISEGMTHWELLQQSRQHDVSEELVADIETVVEAFEMAAFASVSVDPSRAEAAVERAREIRSNGTK